MYPAWRWTTKPWLKFFATSAVDDNVYRDARRHRELVESDWYCQLFQPEWEVKAGQKAKGYWANSAGGERISRTVGQQIVGVKAHEGIVDDPLDPRDAHIDRAKLISHVDWFNTSFSPRMIHATSPILVVMQRLHAMDLAGKLAGEGGVRESCCGRYDPRTEVGEILPRFSAADLDHYRKRLGSSYEAQFNQMPVPAGGTLFRESWLHNWWRSDPACALRWISVDCAYREGRTNDYTVVQLWGSNGAAVYLLAQLRGRWDPAVMESQILLMLGREPRTKFILIERCASTCPTSAPPRR
jgi:hypothetical protein